MQGLARLAVVAAVLAVSAATGPPDAEKPAYSTGTLHDGEKHVELQLKSGVNQDAVKSLLDEKWVAGEGVGNPVLVKRPLGQGDDSDSSSDRQDARGRSGSDESGGDDVAELGGAQAFLKYTNRYPGPNVAQSDAAEVDWVSTKQLTGKGTKVLEKVISRLTKKGRGGDGSADGDSSDSQDGRMRTTMGRMRAIEGNDGWRTTNRVNEGYDGVMTKALDQKAWKEKVNPNGNDGPLKTTQRYFNGIISAKVKEGYGGDTSDESSSDDAGDRSRSADEAPWPEAPKDAPKPAADWQAVHLKVDNHPVE